MSDVTALVPARNEADCLPDTLPALARQGRGLRIRLIDDNSSDATVAVAEGVMADSAADFRVIRGRPLPTGWSGKPWALQQGLEAADSEIILLLDADIQLQPGTVAAMRRKMREEERQLVSLMAVLRMHNHWEKLLLPAFVYFFKLLYPFRLANSPQPLIAAAAGGCVLLQRRALLEIGGFAALGDAIIDDCALARKIKNAGYRIWIGLTRSAVSLRPYDDPNAVWELVARSAFTQLRYSVPLLLLCTALMAAAFVSPLLAMLAPLLLSSPPEQVLVGGLGLATLGLMSLSYLPVLRYYRLSPLWALVLPAVGILYLCMTWSSARRHWRGGGASWKGREYVVSGGRHSARKPD